MDLYSIANVIAFIIALTFGMMAIDILKEIFFGGKRNYEKDYTIPAEPAFVSATVDTFVSTAKKRGRPAGNSGKNSTKTKKTKDSGRSDSGSKDTKTRTSTGSRFKDIRKGHSRR